MSKEIEADGRSMRMIRTLKFRIYPSEEQVNQIEITLGCCRYVYNKMLERSSKAYARRSEHVSYLSMQQLLPRMKQYLPWLKEADGSALRYACRQLDGAYQKFFKGLEVEYGHIETGQDFFDYTEPQGEIVVSNPPFSKRDAIFERLYQMQVPFALVMNFNGLFDSKKRVRVFRDNEIEILVPIGRMKFIHKDKGKINSPNFQSVYVCSGVLERQITFSNCEF